MSPFGFYILDGSEWLNYYFSKEIRVKNCLVFSLVLFRANQSFSIRPGEPKTGEGKVALTFSYFLAVACILAHPVECTGN